MLEEKILDANNYTKYKNGNKHYDRIAKEVCSIGPGDLLHLHLYFFKKGGYLII